MRVTFDDFIFDSDTKELRRQEQSVPLSPKAFQLLEILIENRPKALSKSALHDCLWPNTFVVEANLSNLTGEIRRALDDDPRQPRYIRTVHRFGYAFRADTADLARRDTSSVVCRLIWASGSATLHEGEHILGRDAEAEVFLDSPSVSRRHARIRIADGCATFEDLGSKNGSSVGDRPALGLVPLADGDVITTGIIELTFRMVRPAFPQRPWSGGVDFSAAGRAGSTPQPCASQDDCRRRAEHRTTDVFRFRSTGQHHGSCPACRTCRSRAQWRAEKVGR